LSDVVTRAESARLDTASLRETAEATAVEAQRLGERAREAQETADADRARSREADDHRQQTASALHAHIVRLETLRESVRQPDGSSSVA
ncbi:hypothetical protein, partial [Bradyrhizobium cosmicum]|uniref:hypothetical protein n=1 Tax=Bradyrhizobium cosmicum TaxID=1404864 RepID=UPI0028E54897